jgi:hypothetical protein
MRNISTPVRLSWMVLFALLVFPWAPPAYGQARFEGLVYRKGSNRSELLFKKYNEIVSAGDFPGSIRIPGLPAAINSLTVTKL